MLTNWIAGVRLSLVAKKCSTGLSRWEQARLSFLSHLLRWTMPRIIIREHVALLRLRWRLWRRRRLLKQIDKQLSALGIDPKENE